MAIQWGINGHPLYGYSISIEKQLSLVKEMGLSSYRIDVHDANPQTVSHVADILAAGKEMGVTVLPILGLYPGNYSSESQAYSAGLAMAQTYAKAFPGMVWELGNEFDNFCIKPGASGQNASDYDNAKYAIARGLLNGMYTGIHQADPTSKGIVDNAGWFHFGFMERLAADGVEWDISGEHFYSDMGSMLNVGGSGTDALAALAKFGKPIMVTEFNYRDGSMHGSQAQIDYLNKTMGELNSVAAKYNIIGAHIYELLDEPNQSGGEANYGLATAGGALKATGLAVQDYLEAHPGSGTPDPMPVPAPSDWIHGTSGKDNLTGTSGNDKIDGHAGADIMSGGGGNDTYVVDNAADKVLESVGKGTDSVMSYASSYTLSTNVEMLVLAGTGAQNGTGNGGANTITGNGAANVLDGGGGADVMKGGLGNDTYYLGQSGDKVVELSGQGVDTVKASVSYTLGPFEENLQMQGTANLTGTGSAWHNVMTGNSGHNVLSGLAGNDELSGGRGNDVLIGGTGKDTFVLKAPGSGLDTVKDFKTSDDTFKVTVLLKSLGESSAKAALQHHTLELVQKGAHTEMIAHAAGQTAAKIAVIENIEASALARTADHWV